MDCLQQNLEFFKERRENEFTCSTSNGLLYPANFFFPLPHWEKEIVTAWEEMEEMGEGKFPYFIIPQHIIQSLAPENIDLKTFWQECESMFPQITIRGFSLDIPIKTKEDLNKNSIRQMEAAQLPNFYQTLFNKIENPTILEIGPGYGALPQMLTQHNLPINNYWATDVQYLFFHDNFYVGDGWNIPKAIPYELDNVIALNVFQHLSPLQRSGYFKQIVERLKSGGTFIFTLFLRDEKNEKAPLWSYRDEENNYYCYFFNQFTQVPTTTEIITELENLGFELYNSVLKSNVGLLILGKK